MQISPSGQPSPLQGIYATSPDAAWSREQCRYRDEGYPLFVEWMSESTDFSVLRRFKQLNTRVLLFMQYKIEVKEKLLLECDDHIKADEKGRCDSFAADSGKHREKLLMDLSFMLKEYSTINSGYIRTM